MTSNWDIAILPPTTEDHDRIIASSKQHEARVVKFTGALPYGIPFAGVFIFKPGNAVEIAVTGKAGIIKLIKATLSVPFLKLKFTPGKLTVNDDDASINVENTGKKEVKIAIWYDKFNMLVICLSDEIIATVPVEFPDVTGFLVFMKVDGFDNIRYVRDNSDTKIMQNLSMPYFGEFNGVKSTDIVSIQGYVYKCMKASFTLSTGDVYSIFFNPGHGKVVFKKGGSIESSIVIPDYTSRASVFLEVHAQKDGRSVIFINGYRHDVPWNIQQLRKVHIEHMTALTNFKIYKLPTPQCCNLT